MGSRPYPSHRARLQARFLDTLIAVCDRPSARWLAERLCLNRTRIEKDQAIEEIVTAVSDHYWDHRLEHGLASRQARIYQKYFFRQKIRRLRQQLAQPDIDAAQRQRYEALIAEFRDHYEELIHLRDPEETLRHLTRYYAEDMVCELNPAFFGVFKRLSLRLFRNFVRNIQNHTPASVQKQISDLSGREPLFFVPNHISNADHIPICLAINAGGGLQPQIAAGANLFRGASAKIMPRLNAYKIRREQIGEGVGLLRMRWFQNPIYRRTHSEYLRHVWSHNEPFMFYIEGTRSRDGRIGAPKLGILEEIFQYLRDSGRRGHFVPVSLAYTLVPEDREIEAARQGENISKQDLIAQLMHLDREYGQFDQVPIQLRFGEPIATDGHSEAAAFGEALVEQIRAQLVPSATSCLAQAIIATCTSLEPQHVHRDRLSHYLEQHHPQCAADLDPALAMFISRGFLAPGPAPGDYRIDNLALIEQYAQRIADS